MEPISQANDLMAESTNEGAESDCSSHASHYATIHRDIVCAEVVGAMSEVVLRLEVGVVPEPFAATEITPASVEIAYTSFPSWQVPTMIDARGSSEDYVTSSVMYRASHYCVMAGVVQGMCSVPTHYHLMACVVACMTPAASLSIYVNTCHHHGYHDHY